MQSLSEAILDTINDKRRNPASARQLQESSSEESLNDSLGDTSFLLAAYLEQELRAHDTSWHTSGKWMDDSLFRKVTVEEDRISIYGVMIWGKGGTTEQWTEPFYFEAFFDQIIAKYTHFNLFFGDINHPAKPYERYSETLFPSTYKWHFNT